MFRSGEELRTREGNHSHIVPSLELNLHICPFSSGVETPFNITISPLLVGIAGTYTSQPSTPERQSLSVIPSQEDAYTHQERLVRGRRWPTEPSKQ